MKGYITLSEAVDHFHVSETTIRLWIKQGKLTAKRDGKGKWQVKANQKSPEKKAKVTSCDAPIAGYYIPGRWIGDPNVTTL